MPTAGRADRSTCVIFIRKVRTLLAVLLAMHEQGHCAGTSSAIYVTIGPVADFVAAGACNKAVELHQ